MLQFSQTAERRSFDHQLARPRQRQRHPELERLICDAVIDPALGALLVRAPDQALMRWKDAHRLSQTERRLVCSITDAPDIHDYAGQLHARIGIEQQPGDASLGPWEDEADGVSLGQFQERIFDTAR